jgi:hypothetical protein
MAANCDAVIVSGSVKVKESGKWCADKQREQNRVEKVNE